MGSGSVCASMAKRLCLDANETAELGGKVMKEAVAAMKAINEASAKMAAMVGVIDEIAIQTNLLALNALVVARNGEQGAVASEVRNLAGHSAKAAREIKALIGASDTRVEEGVRLVSQSGVLFEEIVVAIRKVNDMINEIGG